jgi:hypothetical protein
MRVGLKATGQEQFGKLCVVRHGRGSRRACNALEKAIETRVRRSGKKAVKIAWLDL